MDVKNVFSKQDVLDYIEEKIVNGEYTEDEYDFYLSYKWDGLIKKHTYKKLYREMLDQYFG